MFTHSNANGQRCLFCGKTFPLYPPIVAGCPACATEDFKAPLELTFDYPEDLDWLPEAPLPGIDRYVPLLPPLKRDLSLGEGGTPLIPIPQHELSDKYELYIKDESRNPTWSHKDRLNYAVVSAAVKVGANGVVSASSGNHGGSSSAYSARSGLPGVILTTTRPPAIASFLQAYGQIVVAVPDVYTRWELMARLVDEMNYHPASNQTIPPTNHPFGAENYKTIAYELYLQLGKRSPEAVFVPVGFAELIFGIYKGFVELKQYGKIDELPRMIACEPAAGAPLKKALEVKKPTLMVETDDSDAYSITVPINSYRGVVAVKGSNGDAIAVPDEESKKAQCALGRMGIWSELSSAIAYAGVNHLKDLGITKGPVVFINSSSGFKDINVGKYPVPEIDGSWNALVDLLAERGII